MLKIILQIKELDIFYPLFYVDVSQEYIDEIFQAIYGEIHYNNSELDFGGFIYE